MPALHKFTGVCALLLCLAHASAANAFQAEVKDHVSKCSRYDEVARERVEYDPQPAQLKPINQPRETFSLYDIRVDALGPGPCGFHEMTITVKSAVNVSLVRGVVVEAILIDEDGNQVKSANEFYRVSSESPNLVKVPHNPRLPIPEDRRMRLYFPGDYDFKPVKLRIREISSYDNVMREYPIP